MKRKMELITMALTFVGVIVSVLAWRWPVAETASLNMATQGWSIDTGYSKF